MADKLVQLVEKCHHVMSENYDSSLNIPSDILREAGQQELFRKRWTDYLRYKFRYLVLLETDGGNEADTKIGAELRSNGVQYLSRFLPQWKARAKKERTVYSYRRCQLPPQTVEAIWYDPQTPECTEWCQKRNEELELLDAKATGSTWGEWLPQIYAQIGRRPITTCEQERMLSAVFRRAAGGLVDRVNSVRRYMTRFPVASATSARLSKKYQQAMAEVARCFECFKNTPLQDVVVDTSLVGSNLLAELSFELMKVLHNSGFDEIAVVTQFLQSLKAHFQCEVCDFLEVTDNGEKIVLRAATVNHRDLSARYQKLSEDERRQHVLARESYRRGEGISGTILLLGGDADRNTWYHVGSNDVQHDPRQSRKHRSAYERDMYPGVLRASGRIENFWMFPVFGGDRLVGAFRVVNKLNGKEELQRGGWPYLTRVQLALVAQWLSRFLEAVQQQLQMREDFFAIMQWNQRLDQMMTTLDLHWVERRTLQAFLRHLERDISKKEEKRPVGCCIIIARVVGRSLPLPELPDYPLLDCRAGAIEDPYSGLDAYHDAVSPLGGAYVFDQKGTFVRAVKLEIRGGRTDTILSGYSAVEKVTSTNREAICLLLPSGAKSVLIYQHGSRVAEVLLSEKTAERRFRYPNEVLEKMVSGAPTVRRAVLKAVCDACIELSFRGYGGMIVVGDVPFDQFSLTEPKVPCKPECDLASMGKDTLVEFAKMDGATFVTNEGRVTKVNRTVTPIKDPGVEPLFPGRGGRHTTGEKISRLAPNALVVIVSENRGISIVARGKLVGPADM